MAGAGAIPQFRDLVVDFRGPLELGMRHRTILIDVATGTIRAEGGKFPADGLGIRHMTAGAAQSRPVIHIGRRRVPVADRCPGRGPMTGLARQGREEMPGRLAFTRRAIVAAGTCCQGAGVIEAGASKGHCALVTGLARCIRADVICRLPGYGPAIVTAGA